MASARNLIMGHGWIFHQDNDPKSTQNCVTEHKMKLLPWPSQSTDLNPVENEWGELKRSASMKEWSLSDLLSGVLQTHQEF